MFGGGGGQDLETPVELDSVPLACFKSMAVCGPAASGADEVPGQQVLANVMPSSDSRVPSRVNRIW